MLHTALNLLTPLRNRAVPGLAAGLIAVGAAGAATNGDGDLDVHIGNEGSGTVPYPSQLFRNDGAGRFTDVAEELGVTLRSREGQAFVDVTFAGGFGHIQKGHGVAFGDIDDDGDQDLFHQIGGVYPGDNFGNALFENPGNDLAWITISLRGSASNRFGVGARLRLDLRTPGGVRSLHRVVGSGGSFGGSSLRQEIVLGDATAIRNVTILWPSGRRQVIDGPAMNRAPLIVEPSDGNATAATPEAPAP